jgi:hypothetical protein
MGEAVIREEFPCQPLHSTANCSVYLIAPSRYRPCPIVTQRKRLLIASFVCAIDFLILRAHRQKGFGLNENFTIPTQPLTGPGEMQRTVAVNKALSNL